jgi:magnesium transporter
MLMLHLCAEGCAAFPGDVTSETLPKGVVWIDLLSPEPDEIAYVERVTGLHVPNMAELSEIESSSRLRSEGDTLYLSTPIVLRSPAAGTPFSTSVGFVLTRALLITVRFEKLMAFQTFMETAKLAGAVQPSGPGAFVGLVDAIIDRIADVLESVGGDLDQISQRVFRMDDAAARRRPAREDADLREVLRRIGRDGDLASKIRDSLLGLGRIVPYVLVVSANWLPAELKPRLETQRQDVLSLNDYDAHLTNKVQLLLDATLGLINIEQNNIIKVLTVVSVVGVPPTLVASLYGMNFHDMPELSWAYGYPYGLTMIFLSAVVPLAWFKLRGWL